MTWKPVSFPRSTALLVTLALAAQCGSPSLEAYEQYLLHPDEEPASDVSGLNITFLGAATILFDDGETAIMTDAFFSRPSLSELRRLESNEDTVTRALVKAGITNLAAVVPVHSHYDHILDAPFVADKTGALFVGSESSANVARGHDLPDSRIRIAEDGETMEFGRFRVTFIVSPHSPNDLVSGAILRPLSPTAHVGQYKTGDCYSLLIEHDTRSMLVHASAGFTPGLLHDHAADVVFLGIGRLGKTSHKYRLSYWNEVVRAVEARRVIPIHWDNFFRSLDEPLEPLPAVIDNFRISMDFLLAVAEETNVDVRLPVAWAAVDPFAGLEEKEAGAHLTTGIAPERATRSK